MEPKKPYVCHGEVPQGEFPEFIEDKDKVSFEARERAALEREAMSGPLGHGPLMDHDIGPRSEEQYQEYLEHCRKVRAAKGGLPDHDPADWPANSKPYSFSE